MNVTVLTIRRSARPSSSCASSAPATFGNSPPVLEPLLRKLIPGLLVPPVILFQIVYFQFLWLPRCYHVFQVLLEAVETVLRFFGQYPSRPPVEERFNCIHYGRQGDQRES